MTSAETKMAYKISIKGMVINLLLFAFKGIMGVLIHSVSLVSDAVHSLTDIFSTLVVLIGLKISNRPADRGHPYGHEKIECIIAFLLGLMLFGIGITIGWEGFTKLKNPSGSYEMLSFLNILAITSALVSIVAKEWMYRFTIKCAKQINSSSMSADAWHHRSDAISSIGSFIGVAGICFGLPVMDVIACFIISIFIFKAAYDICSDSCKRMIDEAADNRIINDIQNAILSNKEVLALDMIKTRQFGAKLYVDIEVTLDHNMSFEHSHEVAHILHDNLESTFSEIKHCMIHVNPS